MKKMQKKQNKEKEKEMEKKKKWKRKRVLKNKEVWDIILYDFEYPRGWIYYSIKPSPLSFYNLLGTLKIYI